MNSDIYNFYSGPSVLPQQVLEKACDGILNFNGSGLSVLGINHRSRNVDDIAEYSESLLREILNIPRNYHVLFLHGGARSQFSMVPMNLLQKGQKAAYFNTGIWSKFAIDEAKKYGRVSIVTDSTESNYTTIADRGNWNIEDDITYIHYTANETANGVEFPFIPDINEDLLVSDMSSNFLSRSFDITKFGLIYACAQKNLGPAGVTIVIIRDDLIKEPLSSTPSMFKYINHVKYKSKFNTPPIFNWFVVGLVLEWIKEQGGLDVIAANNQYKSKIIYDAIDKSSFYINPVDKKYRSQMNIIFQINSCDLTEKFVSEAEKNGLYGLRGHPLVGGLRCALYNSMSVAGVKNLADFMEYFKCKYGCL